MNSVPQDLHTGHLSQFVPACWSPWENGTIERDFEVRECSTKSKTYWHRTEPCLLSLLHDTEWSIASSKLTRAIQADMNGRSKEERQSRGNLWIIVQCTSRDVHVTRYPRCYAYVWRSDWSALIYVRHGEQCFAWTFACCFLGGLFVFCERTHRYGCHWGSGDRQDLETSWLWFDRQPTAKSTANSCKHTGYN